MLILYTYGPAAGQADASPFVMKTMLQLGMAGVPFETRSGFLALMRAPKGKLPYIRDADGTVVADSGFIRDHLERTRGVDLDSGHDARDRALGWAAEKLLEDNLYFAALQARWIRPAGFAVVERALFGRMPRPIRGVVAGMARRSVRRALHGQGMGRHSADEIDRLADRGFQAVATLLGDKPFLLGDAPAGVDATLAAFTAAAASDAFPGPLRDAVLGRPNLMAHRDRVWARFGPATPAQR